MHCFDLNIKNKESLQALRQSLEQLLSFFVSIRNSFNKQRRLHPPASLGQCPSSASALFAKSPTQQPIPTLKKTKNGQNGVFFFFFQARVELFSFRNSNLRDFPLWLFVSLFHFPLPLSLNQQHLSLSQLSVSISFSFLLLSSLHSPPPGLFFFVICFICSILLLLVIC